MTNNDIIKLLTFYFKHAKASRYYVVFKDTDRVIFYDFSADEFHEILLKNGVCKIELRSEARKGFDGKKQSKHLRLKMNAFRRAVCSIYGDNTRGCSAYAGEMMLTDYENFEHEFCEKFHCTLKLKNDGVHYTHGDCMEYLAFTRIAGNGEKWYKNTRSYKHGTDCDIYEIKGFGFGDPTISPQINQHI